MVDQEGDQINSEANKVVNAHLVDINRAQLGQTTVAIRIC